jgi:hypothetical protein
MRPWSYYCVSCDSKAFDCFEGAEFSCFKSVLTPRSSIILLTQMVQCSSLQPLAQNPHHFLVGADGGRVLKGSWVGVAPAPKEYLPHDHNAAAILKGTGRTRVPSCVTALHVSPVCPWAFLSGHDDGTVALHSLALSTAAAVWPAVAAGGVKALRWSPARPSVFFVLDAICMISCFDLSKNKYV